MAPEAIHDLALEAVDAVSKALAVPADHRPNMVFPPRSAIENRLNARHSSEDVDEAVLDVLDLADRVAVVLHVSTSLRDLTTV